MIIIVVLVFIRPVFSIWMSSTRDSHLNYLSICKPGVTDWNLTFPGVLYTMDIPPAGFIVVREQQNCSLIFVVGDPSSRRLRKRGSKSDPPPEQWKIFEIDMATGKVLFNTSVTGGPSISPVMYGGFMNAFSDKFYFTVMDEEKGFGGYVKIFDLNERKVEEWYKYFFTPWFPFRNGEEDTIISQYYKKNCSCQSKQDSRCFTYRALGVGKDYPPDWETKIEVGLLDPPASTTVTHSNFSYVFSRIDHVDAPVQLIKTDLRNGQQQIRTIAYSKQENPIYYTAVSNVPSLPLYYYWKYSYQLKKWTLVCYFNEPFTKLAWYWILPTEMEHMVKANGMTGNGDLPIIPRVSQDGVWILFLLADDKKKHTFLMLFNHWGAPCVHQETPYWNCVDSRLMINKFLMVCQKDDTGEGFDVIITDTKGHTVATYSYPHYTYDIPVVIDNDNNFYVCVKENQNNEEAQVLCQKRSVPK